MSVSVMPFPMADITFGERNLDRHPIRHGGKPFVMAETISQFRMLWRKFIVLWRKLFRGFECYGGNSFSYGRIYLASQNPWRKRSFMRRLFNGA
jgi:hypothetical protein